MAYEAHNTAALDLCHCTAASIFRQGRGCCMSCNVHKIKAGWFCVQVLGAKEGFFVKLVDSVVDNFGGFYPELVAKRDHITGVIMCAAVVTL